MKGSNETPERFADSVLFSAAGVLFSRALSVIGILFLARLLAPADFGILAIVSVLTGFAMLFVDIGLGASLVHVRIATRQDYSTVFAFNFAIGLLIALLIVFSANAIAEFFNEASAASAVQASAFLLVVNALSIVPQAILQKGRRFRPIAVTEVGASAIALVFAIWLAFKGFGVWALIANLYIAGILRFLFFACYTKWLPGTLPSVRAFLSLWSFSGYLLGSSILDFIATQADKVIVGRNFASDRLGSYDLASKLTLLPVSLVISILGRVLFPTYAASREDMSAVRRAHTEVMELLGFLLIPCMIGLSVHAEPLVLLLLGSKWSESVRFIEVLALVYILRAIGGVNVPIFLALGETRKQFALMLFSSIVIVACMLVGVQYGISGLLVALVAGRIIIAVPSLYIPAGLIGMRLRDVGTALAPPVLAGSLGAASVLLLRAWVDGASESYLWTAASISLFALVYVALLRIAWPNFLHAQLGRLTPLLGGRPGG